MPYRTAIFRLEKQIELAKNIIEGVYDNGNDIPFDDVAKLPIHKTVIVAGANNSGEMSAYVLQKEKNKIINIGYISPFCEVGTHYHSDLIESIYVVSGSIIDGISKKEADVGEWIIFKPGEMHHLFVGESGAQLIVIFDRVV